MKIKRWCRGDHRTFATIELKSVDADRKRRHKYVWLCIGCFDKYVRKESENTYTIKYSLNEGLFVDHYFTISEFFHE